MVKLTKEIADIITDEVDKLELDTKIELYKKNGACKSILDILSKQKNNRKWGEMMEYITIRIFNFDDRDNTEHDFKYEKIKIEQKTSTLLNKDIKKNKKTFQYHDIRDGYDYDYLLLCNVDFNELKYYVISKKDMLKLDLFKNQKRCRILNFDRIKKHLTELTEENVDKVLI